VLVVDGGVARVWHIDCSRDRRTGETIMLDTLAKTAVVGTALTLVRRLQGKNEATVLGSIGLVAAGIIIGGGAALLLTPKTGAELRGDVAKKAKQLKSGAQERFMRAKEAALAETH